MGEMLPLLLSAAFIQNVVLTTGFGSSVMLRTTRKRRDILPFSILLCLFTVLTVLICFPLDALIGTSVVAKWCRPLMIVMVTALLYIAVALLLKKRFSAVYARVRRLLPMAAFNNLVIGIALIVNHQFAVGLPGALGLAFGACLGFLLLSWLTAEGMERLDNPDVPGAFRGLPSVLALALLGFSGGRPMI